MMAELSQKKRGLKIPLKKKLLSMPEIDSIFCGTELLSLSLEQKAQQTDFVDLRHPTRMSESKCAFLDMTTKRDVVVFDASELTESKNLNYRRINIQTTDVTIDALAA